MEWLRLVEFFGSGLDEYYSKTGTPSAGQDGGLRILVLWDSGVSGDDSWAGFNDKKRICKSE